MADSFLFYDLETSGLDPRRGRIAQFAAQRTNLALEPIADPVDFLVRPADDLLPSPTGTLITGITPQRMREAGVLEADALARIHELVASPGTCALGYNSIRFDDEFLRHGFWRNFLPVYDREWRNGNSRFDLLDVLRLAHVLRPEGICWPLRDDGSAVTSFRLEDLAIANGVRDGDAHEALSDVRATLGMARLLRQAQPRLWDYTLRLRDKRHVTSLLDPVTASPLLHVSGRLPAERRHAAIVLPLVALDDRQREVVVADLSEDPSAWLSLDVEAIQQRLFTERKKRPEGMPRIGLKTVHANRAPMLVPWSHLRPADFERLDLDPAQVEANAMQLRAAQPTLAETLRRAFARAPDADAADLDPEHSLYGGGFLSDADERLRARARATHPEHLRGLAFAFRDPRLDVLLLRYRARNWPTTLTEAEQTAWRDYRRERLFGNARLGEQTFADWQAEIAALRLTQGDDPGKRAILDALVAWGHDITTDLLPDRAQS